MAKNENYEDVDPRVKWAFDILDWGDVEPVPIYYKYVAPAVCTFFGAVSVPAHNKYHRFPMKRSAAFIPVLTAVGFAAGMGFKNLIEQKAAKDMAIIKHYIMCNPEKFPEPIRYKYGDKELLQPWGPIVR